MATVALVKIIKTLKITNVKPLGLSTPIYMDKIVHKKYNNIFIIQINICNSYSIHSFSSNLLQNLFTDIIYIKSTS